MKIFVTGGAGFIGSSFVRLCVNRGYDVVNIDALTYSGLLSNVESVSGCQNYQFANLDIRDLEALTRLFDYHEPDAVVHLAAESHVDNSIKGPSEFISTNIVGTFNILEASRHYWLKKGRFDNFRFLHVSTDEVFGSLGPVGSFSEDSPYAPRSPYSASKASSDHLVRAWNETYGLPTLITNCSNNYGPHQFPEKLIPTVILNSLQEKIIPIYGDGSNVRDWLFVDDHADALLKVLVSGVVGRSYNIGGNNEFSNLELVDGICVILDKVLPRRYGFYSDLIDFVGDRPGHDQRYSIDSSRIKSELGWTPSVDFQTGLDLTVRWYLNNRDWWLPLLENHRLGNRFGESL